MSLGQAWVDKGFDAVSRAKAWLDDDVKGMTQGQVALVALAGASVGALTTYLRLEGRKGRGRGRRERRRSEGETKTKVTEQPASVVTLPPAPEPAPAPAPAQIEVEEVEEPPKRSAVRGEGDLALRAAGAIKPALSYIDIFLEALGNQWSPSNNTGYIVLLIAENKLTTELVSKRFRQVKSVPDDVFAYNSFRGAPEFRSAVAQYAELTFASGCTIDPEDLSISSGCGAVIDNICFSVCEAGSEVLIPAPYYPAFDNDLRVKSKVEPVPVMPTTTATVAATEEGGGGGAEDKTFLPSNEDLDSAFSKCKNPRILLLTNPHNPMGIVLPPQEIKRCIKWALQKGMHVISDEIYANSIYQPEHHEKFRSAIALMPELSAELGKGLVEERLHTIFGFSKDFCSSGLRIGCLYTRNQMLLKAQDNIGYFCGVSGHTAYVMTKVLEDTAFVQKFISKNHKRLRSSYQKLSEKLTKAQIDFVPANAGMFVWIDMRKYLREKTFEAERVLWTGLAQDAKVLFTPGQDCHALEPGYFRICFAWMPEQALSLAIDRVKKYVDNI